MMEANLDGPGRLTARRDTRSPWRNSARGITVSPGLNHAFTTLPTSNLDALIKVSPQDGIYPHSWNESPLVNNSFARTVLVKIVCPSRKLSPC